MEKDVIQGIQRADTLEQDQENKPNNRQRARTAQDYAYRVRTHASITASESFHPGDSLRNLADFLWQPCIRRATQIDSISTPSVTTTPHQRPCFASLYQISNGSMLQLPLDTAKKFEDLGESVIPSQNCFSLLLLQGYPSPRWLNALGARYGIDPEYYHRHLLFASASNKGLHKRTATNILPSCIGDMVSLKVTKIGSEESTRHSGEQEKLDSLRKHSAKDMASYMTKLASLNTTGIEAGDSIVREFSLHDFDYFSLEQTISLGIHPVGQGWIGIIWDDEGGPLENGLKGPWSIPAIGSDSLVKYLPTSFHTPGIALKSKKRKVSTPPVSRDRPRTRMELLFDDYSRTIDLVRATYDPFYALSPFFKFAVSSEMELLDLISAKTRDTLDHSLLIHRDNPTLSNILYHQQVLKCHIQGLQAPISFMEGLQESPWFEKMTDQQQKQCARTINSTLKDYRAALNYAKALISECVQGMSIVAHNASILEAEKAITEARGVTKLTRLATIFAPLAFVTSVFSMNVQQINSNGPDIWWWICVSTVIAVLTGLFFRYDVPKLWRIWRRQHITFYRNRRPARKTGSESSSLPPDLEALEGSPGS
ncbi:hypothetical protein F4805DRAFT_476069 [Annulohypoxylon moriforme]|nr:hypothetical protein F4805DRAFT_476069 [Annulohypoxylon moriforme]